MDFKNKDVALSGLAGLLFGLLALPIIQNLAILQKISNSVIFNAAIPVVLALAAMAAMALVIKLNSAWPVIFEISKFVIVGGLNTMVDFGVLNVFIFTTGLAIGFPYAVFKSISFVAAALNSYVWNKYWTFDSKNKESKEIIQFFAVSILGFLINVGIASFIVTYVTLAGATDEWMANIGAGMGTVLGLIWNYVGYKYLVFKKKPDVAPL